MDGISVNELRYVIKEKFDFVGNNETNEDWMNIYIN
jgi:hypothetical protein